MNPSRTPSGDSRFTSLVVRSYGATDRGRLRPTNEDQFLIADLTKAMHVRQTSLAQSSARFAEQRGHLFLVADGMGGHHAREHASALAVSLIEQFALNTFQWFMPLTAAHGEHVVTDFQEAVEQADATIVEASRQRTELHGMGTTLTLAYHYEAELLVVHVGDSRAYLFRDEALHQITQDHTVVAEMVRRGELDSAEARRHRLRHVITNVVGGCLLFERLGVASNVGLPTRSICGTRLSRASISSRRCRISCVELSSVLYWTSVGSSREPSRCTSRVTGSIRSSNNPPEKPAAARIARFGIPAEGESRRADLKLG